MSRYPKPLTQLLSQQFHFVCSCEIAWRELFHSGNRGKKKSLEVPFLLLLFFFFFELPFSYQTIYPIFHFVPLRSHHSCPPEQKWKEAQLTVPVPLSRLWIQGELKQNRAHGERGHVLLLPLHVPQF